MNGNNSCLKPPQQTFCRYNSHSEYKPALLDENDNLPMFNNINPDQFISYMLGSYEACLQWSYYDHACTIDIRNIYRPFSGSGKVQLF